MLKNIIFSTVEKEVEEEGRGGREKRDSIRKVVVGHVRKPYIMCIFVQKCMEKR